MKKNLTELLILAQNGDNHAYSLFLNQAADFLRKIMSKWIKNSEIKEELVQETLLSIHQNVHTFQSNLKAEPWISTIARYKVIDHLRRNRHQYQELTEDVTNSLQDTNSSLENHDDSWKYFHELVKTELEKLDELSKMAIIKTKFEDKSTREAAIELGLKENALRTRISRGMQKLRKNLLGLQD